ncbi:MAG: hypothetical protein ACKOAF_08130 [Actinomycetes bacterium]
MSGSNRRCWQGLPLTWPSLLVLPSRPPKLVYLDLLHWINLAKCDLGQEAPAGYVELLDASRAASIGGTVRFVLSDSILMEMANIRHPDQRHAVGSLMEELTGFSMLLNHGMVSFLELIEVLEGLAPGGPRLLPVPLVASNASHAMGVQTTLRLTNAEGLDTTQEVIREQGLAWFEDLQSTAGQMLNRGLLHGPTDEELGELRTLGYRPEALRAIASQRLVQEVWLADNLISNGRDWRRGRLCDVISAREVAIELGDSITQWLMPRGLTIGDILEGRDDFRSFVMSLPTVRVSVAIKCEYHRNPRRRWEQNDIHDIDMASLAVPYCDALFADKELRDALVRSGVHEDFGTFLPRRPADLADWLRVSES